MLMHCLAVAAVATGAAGAAEPVLEWRYDTSGKIYTSPLIADLDGDGSSEIVIAASRDRRLLCLDGRGQLLWSTEINDGHPDGLQATPSIVDYEGDRTQEIIAVAKGGMVVCLTHEGSVRWQTHLHDEVDYSGPAVADINADGFLEIVVGSESGTLYCLDDTGARLWHYQGAGAIRGIPAIGRDPRGAMLRVYATFSGGMLGCFDGEGNLVWSQDEPGPRGERRSGVAVGDLDGDGAEEVVSATEDFTVIVSDAATGEERWRWKGAHAIDQTNSFALADFDGSGTLDIVCGDGLGLSRPGNVYRLRDGQASWTADAGGGVVQGPSVGDVDGDGALEILVCSRSQKLICLGEDGSEEWSYSAEAGCLTTPAIGDVDQDGQVEIVFTSKDRSIYCVSVGGALQPGRMPWPNINGDPQLTGNAEPVVFTARPAEAIDLPKSPMRVKHDMDDDLTTVHLTVRVTNMEPWSRRMGLRVEHENGFHYSNESRFKAFESEDMRITLQVFRDGDSDVRFTLYDASSSRELGTMSHTIPMNNIIRVQHALAMLRNIFRDAMSDDARRAVRGRSAAEFDHATRDLTAALNDLMATSATKQGRVAALERAASAIRNAQDWAARAKALSVGATSDAMAVLAEHSLRKVFRDEPFFGGAQIAKVAMARNEREAIQIVVVPLWQDLQGVQVSIDDLKLPGTDRLLRATVAPIGYVPIGVPEYSFPVEHLGEWPDILLPDLPTNVPGTQNAQPFWITIATDPDTAPGVYEGTIHVMAENVEPVVMPLKVEVWDFELPQETSLKTSFWINENYVARFYGYDGRLPWDVRKRWYDAHLERRVGPVMSFPLDGGDMMEDFDYLMNHGQNVLFVNVPHEMDETKWPALAERFTSTRDVLESRGWSDEALLYSWDEIAVVGRHQIPEFVKMNTWLKESVPWWPRLETSAPELALLGAVDVWCPTIDNFDPALLADRMAQGERLWFYTVWGRPGIMIEFPATDHRLMFWECWKYGAEGFLYWGTTHWDLNLETERRWPEIPWIPWNRQPGHNGCGYLFYPGPDGQPLSSIRLEVVRDGIEDYEYLHLLQSLLDRAGAALPGDLAARTTRELDVDPTVVADHKTFTENPELIFQARDRIAESILRIQSWMARR